jgi:ubiquinone biosynthesis protein
MAGFVRGLFRVPGLALRAGRVGVVVCCYIFVFVCSSLAGRIRGKRQGRGFGNGDRWVRMLTRLGPSYVKIGQLLSTRRDLLPDTMTLPLARLNDSSRPPKARKLERAVWDAYSHRTWPFREFGWEPIACGSIATVHEAWTWDGRHVAVKVRRPGIRSIMRKDFALAHSAMAVAGVLPGLRKLPVKVMYDQVGSAILHQLDFQAEVNSLFALRENLAGFPDVRIPGPMPDLCTDDTVVMEFVEDLRQFEPGDLNLADRQEVVRSVLAVIYEMLFIDGLVHCDLHPGNLYIDRGTGLVMLDAGFVIQLPDTVRRAFADFFINMAMGDGWMCAQIVIDSATQISPDSDQDGFRAALAALVAESSGARAADFELAKFAGKLFDLQRRFGLFPAPEFAFPLLSLLVIEGMIKGFDADVDFQAEAVPVLARRNSPRKVPAGVAG